MMFHVRFSQAFINNYKLSMISLLFIYCWCNKGLHLHGVRPSQPLNVATTHTISPHQIYFYILNQYMTYPERCRRV